MLFNVLAWVMGILGMVVITTLAVGTAVEP